MIFVYIVSGASDCVNVENERNTLLLSSLTIPGVHKK